MCAECVILVNHESYVLQFFGQAVSANAVLVNALDDRRAFGTFKKLLLLIDSHQRERESGTSHAT